MVNDAVPDQEAILRRIAEVARRHLEWDGTRLDSEQPLAAAMRLDSLRLLTLVIEVENEFRICLDEGDEAGVETAGDLARLVHERLAAAPPPT